MSGDERLRRIAERIADGDPVDWDSEIGEGPDMSIEMENLHVVDRVRAMHAAADEDTREASPVEEGRDAATTPSGKKWGPLELIEEVGRGSFGEVWRAWDPSLQTFVALKLLFPRDRDKDEVLREARQMARVRHENVVTVHGAAEHEGRVGIWMTLLQGQTLEERLAEHGAMSAAEAAAVGLDLVRAVAAVHGAGLVHRDVKLSNVMREEGGRIVLMDFGTVVDRHKAPVAPEVDAFTGTAQYMAPEIFAGERPGKSSDLYALGVVLYRLVAGRYPKDPMTAATSGSFPDPGETTPLSDVRPDLPAWFVRIVERALAPDPTRRYASAGGMERDLAASLARPPRRSLWPRLAAAAALLVAGVWGIRGAVGSGFQVEAALYREAEGQEEQLSSGGRVRPGDQLFLELECTRGAHAYVFTEDGVGSAYLLFPLKGVEPANPISAGTRHTLPGEIEGVPQRWNVTSAGGEERFYVIVSKRPLRELEAEVALLPEVGTGNALAVPPASVRRGIGGLGPAPEAPDDEEGPVLSGLFRRIAGRAASADGLWAWSIRLENPAP